MSSPPTPLTPEARRARAMLASSSAAVGPDHPRTIAAREVYEAEQAISRIFAGLALMKNLSGLTGEQRVRTRALLREGMALINNLP